MIEMSVENMLADLLARFPRGIEVFLSDFRCSEVVCFGSLNRAKAAQHDTLALCPGPAVRCTSRG